MSAADPTDRLRVLVVDDQPDIAELLCEVLVRVGHDCRVASTGAEALEMTATYDPHVILLDIGLPDMSGYAVCTELRSRGVRAYVVAITGWGREDDRKRSFAAGMDEHLVKPTTLETIQAALAVARDARK